MGDERGIKCLMAKLLIADYASLYAPLYFPSHITVKLLSHLTIISYNLVK